MSLKRTTFLVGLSFLTTAACQRQPEETPDIVVTLDPEFTVDLYEQRDALNGMPVLGFWVESVDTFDCSNYSVESDVQIAGDSISIRLLEIQKPDTCLGEPGRAAAFLPVGALNNGSYPFSLSLNEAIVNAGTLHVENGHYELSLQHPQGVDFQNRVLESIPDGLVWGYVAVDTETDLSLADPFLTELKSISAEAGLAPGFYGYFTVSGTGQFFFHRSIAPQGSHQSFLRRLTGSADPLRGLLQQFRNTPGQMVQVKCYSTFGEL